MKKGSKLILILLVTLFACLLIFPTLKWYFLMSIEDKKISSYSQEALRDYSKEKKLWMILLSLRSCIIKIPIAVFRLIFLI